MTKEFCNGCKHKSVSAELKRIFNEQVQNTFITCPFEKEDLIAGCFIKGMEIDWRGFRDFCKEKGYLSKEEE